MARRKTEREGAPPSGIPTIDLDFFPIIEDKANPRLVYVRGMSSIDRAALKARGYNPIDVMTMPRGTTEADMKYLFAKAQGIEEGTIAAGVEDRHRLELQMRALGMLGPKGTTREEDAAARHATLSVLLNWGKSRHVLRNASTVVGASSSIEELQSGNLKAQETLTKARRAAEDKLLTSRKPSRKKASK